MLLSRETEYQGHYKCMKSAIATTWLVSFNHILRDKPLAADMLRYICFLVEKDIPLSLFSQRSDELEVDEAIGILKAYAFIIEREDGLSFDVHRLVQLAMRNWLQEEGQQRDWVKNTVQRLADVFSFPEHENRDLWQQYLPHALSAVNFQEQDVRQQADIDLLFNIAASYALLGKYREAEQMQRQTVRTRQRYLASVRGYEPPAWEVLFRETHFNQRWCNGCSHWVKEGQLDDHWGFCPYGAPSLSDHR
jgi:hypothetical protein